MINHEVRKVQIGDFFEVGDSSKPFTLIAGPCAIENEKMVLETAEKIKDICDKLGINYIFKSSFDKANRSSIYSNRGVGLEDGLAILKKVRDSLNIPIITDVHESWQCGPVGEIVDVIQIPAFLCRQSDLLAAAAKTGKAINVKKGQFLAPWDMGNVVKKLEESGSTKIMLCERGTTFGYNNLVVDMTSLIEMRKFGYPIVFDATHSVQKPGGQGHSTGGNREYVPPLMRAAVAVGVDAIFAEVHPDPDHAISDGPNQLRLDQFESILSSALNIDKQIKNITGG